MNGGWSATNGSLRPGCGARLPLMANAFVHTCVRVRDIEASARFYRALGFEERGRLNFESAYNVYFGLPGDADRLELTVNVGRDEPYELGEGYNHFAMTVEDLDGLLAQLAEMGVEPERAPYHPGGRDDLPRIAFVADPDGYRIELIEGTRFGTPQDPPHPSTA
jgi:lactoylglutathione lyase